MNQDLLMTYGINTAYMVMKAIVFAISCFVAWKFFDIMETKVDIRKEITENKNVGWAVIIAAIFLGLGYVIGQI